VPQPRGAGNRVADLEVPRSAHDLERSAPPAVTTDLADLVSAPGDCVDCDETLRRLRRPRALPHTQWNALDYHAEVVENTSPSATGSCVRMALSAHPGECDQHVSFLKTGPCNRRSLSASNRMSGISKAPSAPAGRSRTRKTRTEARSTPPVRMAHGSNHVLGASSATRRAHPPGVNEHVRQTVAPCRWCMLSRTRLTAR